MAKVVGIIGAASGKVGNVVYAVTNGIQTARVYQPNVSNPKSALQNQQRAKANLVGRVSGFIPRTAIMGLGMNNRTRRSEFLRILFKGAVVTEVNGVFNAKIPQGSIVFSKGSVPLSVINPVVSGSANSISVTLTASSAFEQSVYDAMQTRIVVMIYDLTTQELIKVATRIATKPVGNPTARTDVSISHPEGYIADVYLIPMSTNDGSKLSIDTSMAAKSDSDIAASLSANRNAVVFDYGQSQYAASATYQPA